ncbi:DUF1906 domain-containing protein [Paenibacillus nasutitermitis]|uniref:Rv2525c-like glycoside hydrolase-like domain-containing protein n=1 Tax=Paenibacillus nasutitermitis TaxID=1652958 RepID=A0A917E2Z3_9BACL|nr:DUF1906 domain-containing protein [Paenibacillus nasutitermitis]GGD95266.1 hypothetical protein GCM10010911_62470 [Paenibacillus nasutitermitis]
MAKGLDCAIPLSASNAKVLAGAGFVFAARYLVPERLSWKRLNRAEAEAITSAGMQIVSVYETSANRPAGGAAHGKSDGLAALREAKLIGQPKGSAIYFAVDYDAGQQDYEVIEHYLRAASAQLLDYHTGVYGSYAVIEEMAKRQACSHFWQTYAWSRGKKSQHANIYQYQNDTSVAGVKLDLNESFGKEGWWNTRISEQPVKPPLAQREYKMETRDAQAIIRLLAASYELTTDRQARAEIHRLANEIRRAADIPIP